MPASSLITLALGGTSIQINGPDAGTDIACLNNWVTDQSQGLQRWTYRGTDRYVEQWTIPCSSLTTAQSLLLRDFFYKTALGPTNVFTYTHTDGVVYTARFVDAGLNLRRVNSNEWACTFKLELLGQQVNGTTTSTTSTTTTIGTTTTTTTTSTTSSTTTTPTTTTTSTTTTGGPTTTTSTTTTAGPTTSTTTTAAPFGRCCHGAPPVYDCTVTTQATCNNLGGTWTLNGDCTGDPCNPATTTTTTTTTSTTTTEVSCLSGSCVWESYESGGGGFFWNTSPVDGCSVGCVCSYPAFEPTAAGQFATTGCQ